MYQVNETKFASYLKAIQAANAIGAEVFEVRDNGEKIRRWAPAAPVSSKKVRMYKEHLAACEAQQKCK